MKNCLLIAILIDGGMLLGLSGCAGNQAAGFRATLDHDAIVQVEGEKKRVLKKGESLDAQNSPVLIEAPGRQSLYIVPIDPADGQSITIALRPSGITGGSGSSGAMNDVNTTISGVIDGYHNVQKLLAQSKFNEALVAVEEVKRKYSKVAYLHFLHASCLLMTGDKIKAIAMLKLGLRDEPDHQDALKLLKELEG